MSLSIFRRRRQRSEAYVSVLQHGEEITAIQPSMLLNPVFIAVEVNEKNFPEPRQFSRKQLLGGRKERLQKPNGHKRMITRLRQPTAAPGEWSPTRTERTFQEPDRERQVGLSPAIHYDATPYARMWPAPSPAKLPPMGLLDRLT